MTKNYISSLFILVFFTSLFGTSKVVGQDFPGWYLNPPDDNGNYFYTVGEGETLRGATISAYYNLASKIDSKIEALANSFADEAEGEAEYDSVFSNESKLIVNQNFDGIELSGMMEAFTEEKHEGNKIIWSDSYTQVIRMRLQQGDVFYEATSYIEESLEEGVQNPYYHMESEETISGLDFADFLAYVEEQPGMEITYETRWRETGYDYFVLLKYAVGEARSKLEKALESDEKLYREFKESDAFKKLQEELNKVDPDSTDN